MMGFTERSRKKILLVVEHVPKCGKCPIAGDANGSSSSSSNAESCVRASVVTHASLLRPLLIVECPTPPPSAIISLSAIICHVVSC